MKELLLTMAVALLILSSSCTKSKPDEPIDPITPIDSTSHIIELGKCSVLKNGVPWNALFDAKYYLDNSGKFVISGKGFNNSLEERFSMYDFPAKCGIYLIERSGLWNGNNNIPQGGLGIVLDLDQVLNYYSVDSTRANQYLEILRYDSVNHIVEGRFQTFLEGPSDYPFLPDSVAMTEGKFHLKIEEQ